MIKVRHIVCDMKLYHYSNMLMMQEREQINAFRDDLLKHLPPPHSLKV